MPGVIVTPRDRNAMFDVFLPAAMRQLANRSQLRTQMELATFQEDLRTKRLEGANIREDIETKRLERREDVNIKAKRDFEIEKFRIKQNLKPVPKGITAATVGKNQRIVSVGDKLFLQPIKRTVGKTPISNFLLNKPDATAEEIGTFLKKTKVPAESQLSTLIRERDALQPNDTNRAILQKGIEILTTEKKNKALNELEIIGKSVNVDITKPISQQQAITLIKEITKIKNERRRDTLFEVLLALGFGNKVNTGTTDPITDLNTIEADLKRRQQGLKGQ